ncbi:hypothetical protein O4J56_10925 [Nocardiopsis sp. RSe5-2]|uniref:Uncharacterized protein n=1 Tax=Nocardiopsis endophytica TaxID=3018445 RepID=A0ABT4U2I1_9ACTN|nr:hypothetical protein [Nocardiopsis endophytica]MDA2811150.1 hypothetical protein [Nocardiopsis endophytica]
MSVTYSVPRLDGDAYSRFVELALRYTRWGLGYTSDGTALLFTAAHSCHDVGFSCRDLDDFAELLSATDRYLARLPRNRVRPFLAAHERAVARREARDVHALMTLSQRLGRGDVQEALARHAKSHCEWSR